MTQEECCELAKKFNCFDNVFRHNMERLERYEALERAKDTIHEKEPPIYNKRVCYVMGSDVFRMLLRRIRDFSMIENSDTDDIPF